ncbi:MAG: energy-coupling factor transporter ATPase, partial [Clostridia bacterium]|nr:energy-coupling factor transporter ATPase [Clostridia bacterium]
PKKRVNLLLKTIPFAIIKKLMSTENAIVCENLKFTYPDAPAPAINGIDFTVKKGEFLSVIGHNGSGKSTLARLLNGLLEADEGSINVLGLDLKEGKNAVEVRKHVGIVFQNPDNQMVASIVEDDVAFGPENVGVEREEIGRRIDWALSAVGMESYRTASPARLSGGQKQRIAVAGVLAVKPEILILDESTAMLDPRGRREVVEVVRRLNKEEGITVILITHFMEEALLADRALVFNRGEIVMNGTPEEIFESGEKLETYNLSLPRISVIANNLRAAGMEIKDVLRPEELAAEIALNKQNLTISAGQTTRNQPETEAETAEMQQESEIDAAPENHDIIIENLNFTYSKKSPFATKALNGVNLKIEEGEFFGIIGHTGSGKSTLIQHLNALIKLPQAEKKYKKKRVKKGQPQPVLPAISVGQFDLTSKKCDFKSLRASVGMVFQYPEYQLFADTVFNDVAFGLKNFKKNLKPEEIEQAVKDSIEIVGLNYNEVKEKSPFDLSGGQKRRVAIAGVIVTRPQILILDEPASGLDPKGKNEIMELLHKLHREWCKTVIIVSHDMDEVAENCSKVAVISNGSVFACDAPAKLFCRADELTALGLDIPLTAKFSKALENYGIQIKSDCTVLDFSQKVIQFFGGGGNA